MASSNMLRAGNVCHAGNFQNKSNSLNYIKFRSDSLIKTLPVKFMGANPCLKITAQERTRLHAPFISQASSVDPDAVSAGQTVVATVQVLLINGDNEDPANVYGTIQASNTGNNDKVTLFDRSSSNYVNVRPRKMIPLKNHTVVVPRNSSIVISADLYDEDTFSRDEAIAQGKVKFRAALSGSNNGIINGANGSIQVFVSWARNFA